MEFVKKPLLCDKDVMHTNYIITYGLLAQEHLREYSNIVNSKQVDFKNHAVEMVVTLKEGHLPGQIKLVTSVVKRAIPRKTVGQREMVPVVAHPRCQ